MPDIFVKHKGKIVIKKFKFDLKAGVTIIATGVVGKVISRSDNVNSKDQFCVAHEGKTSGKAIIEWCYENEVKLTPVVKSRIAVKKPAKKAAPTPAVKKRAAPKKRALKSPAPKPA